MRSSLLDVTILYGEEPACTVRDGRAVRAGDDTASSSLENSRDESCIPVPSVETLRGRDQVEMRSPHVGIGAATCRHSDDGMARISSMFGWTVISVRRFLAFPAGESLAATGSNCP
jgi:hypothetical protein